MFRPSRSLAALLAAPLLLLVGLHGAPVDADGSTADKPGLDHVDLMKFRTVPTAILAEDGSWIAFESKPDRGDGTLELRSTDGDRSHTIERGTEPALTPDGRYAAAKVVPTFDEQQKADKKGKGGNGKGKGKGKGGDDGPTDGLALLNTDDGSTVAFERVSAFAFSADGRWLAVHHLADKTDDESEADDETAKASEGEAGEETEEAEEGESVAETEPASEEEGTETASTETEVGEAEGADEESDDAERVGTTLRLRHLADGTETELADVEHFAFDETGRFLAVATARADRDNAVVVYDLTAEGGEPMATPVTATEGGRYTALVWTSDEVERPALGFVAAVDDEDGEPGDGEVWLWDGERREGAVVVAAAWPTDPGPTAGATGDTTGDPAGWQIPSKNELHFSRDGDRLFFGTRPRPESDDEDEGSEGDDTAEATSDDDEGEGGSEAEEEEPADPYDTSAILDEATVDVWHTADPLIKTNERKMWQENEKDRTYLAVHHRSSNRTVQLADRQVRDVNLEADAVDAALGFSDIPYLRHRTWEGFFLDIYRIDLTDGSRERVVERASDPNATLSPDGRFVAFWKDQHWHLYDADSKSLRNLTADLDTGFADERHDYPSQVPGYERPVWLADSSAVVLHDRFDLWRVPVDAGQAPTRLTEGRADHTEYRIVDLHEDDEPRRLEPGATLLLEGYSDREKNDGFWQLDLGSGAVRPLIEEAKRFNVLAKAEDADRILYTRESFQEFPDLWVATTALAERRKLTDVNPQIADFAWGRAELIEFTTNDGVDLQGVLIRPDSLTDEALAAGDRCPVLVYYYRYFSQNLHRFNEPVVNHRPSFPLYTGSGYCVFLPDVVFDIGRPGHSAVQSVVAGVQELVRRGIADPERLGLHGHSWSGYQTAYVVTQTDIFAAAVAGAPVTNMTSAYGGIRYRTGLARQFQYEKTQSRLGVSLWEGRDRYIESSPLFYADRVETPLVMMFGDEDGAVPWTQGIEYYLALRRLDKHAVMLQYRGEGHHLRQYGNKLDYSIKMKEFFDHYLLDAPAPAWWTDGVPYLGDD